MPEATAGVRGIWKVNDDGLPGRASRDLARQPWGSIAALKQERHASNPITQVSASWDNGEQYVPRPVLIGDALWLYVKGSTNLWVWRSTDKGTTWPASPHTASAILAPSLDNTEWDEQYIIDPAVLYDESTGTIHLFYKGGKDTGGGVTWGIGYATASDADPSTLTKQSVAAPVISAADLLAAVADTSLTDMAPSCIIKIGATWYMYGNYRGDTGLYVWYATAAALAGPWTVQGRIGGLADSFVEAGTSEASPQSYPEVLRMPGSDGYTMLFVTGVSSTAVGYTGPRWIEVATSPDGENWTRSGEPFLLPGEDVAWEANRVHSIALLKKPYGDHAEPEVVDGAIQAYYSARNLESFEGTVLDRAGLVYLYPGTTEQKRAPSIHVIPLVTTNTTFTSTTADNFLGINIPIHPDMRGRIARLHGWIGNDTASVQTHVRLGYLPSNGSAAQLGDRTKISATGSGNTRKIGVPFRIPADVEFLRVQGWVGGASTGNILTLGLLVF